MAIGFILQRTEGTRTQRLGSIIWEGSRPIWYYLHAAMYAPRGTMAVNLAGLSLLIVNGGDEALIRHSLGDEWYETDVRTMREHGFIHTFNANHQEPRMNLHLSHWRKMNDSPRGPFWGNQVVSLEDMSPEQFRKLHGPTMTYEEWCESQTEEIPLAQMRLNMR